MAHKMTIGSDPEATSNAIAGFIRGDVREGRARPLPDSVRYSESTPDESLSPGELAAKGDGNCGSIPRAAAPFVKAKYVGVQKLITPDGKLQHHAFLVKGDGDIKLDGRGRAVDPIDADRIHDECILRGMNGGQPMPASFYQGSWLSRIWPEGMRDLSHLVAPIADRVLDQTAYQGGVRRYKPRTDAGAQVAATAHVAARPVSVPVDYEPPPLHDRYQEKVTLDEIKRAEDHAAKVVGLATPTMAMQFAQGLASIAQGAHPEGRLANDPEIGEAHRNAAILMHKIIRVIQSHAKMDRLGLPDEDTLDNLIAALRSCTPSTADGDCLATAISEVHAMLPGCCPDALVDALCDLPAPVVDDFAMFSMAPSIGVIDDDTVDLEGALLPWGVACCSECARGNECAGGACEIDPALQGLGGGVGGGHAGGGGLGGSRSGLGGSRSGLGGSRSGRGGRGGRGRGFGGRGFERGLFGEGFGGFGDIEEIDVGDDDDSGDDDIDVEEIEIPGHRRHRRDFDVDVIGGGHRERRPWWKRMFGGGGGGPTPQQNYPQQNYPQGGSSQSIRTITWPSGSALNPDLTSQGHAITTLPRGSQVYLLRSGQGPQRDWSLVRPVSGGWPQGYIRTRDYSGQVPQGVQPGPVPGVPGAPSLPQPGAPTAALPLIKATTGYDQTVYVVFGGQKHGFPDPGTLAAHGFSMANVQANDAMYQKYPVGTPIPHFNVTPLSNRTGLFVKGSGPTIYVIGGEGKKHGIPDPNTMNQIPGGSLGLPNVVQLPEVNLERIPTGQPLTSGSGSIPLMGATSDSFLVDSPRYEMIDDPILAGAKSKHKTTHGRTARTTAMNKTGGNWGGASGPPAGGSSAPSGHSAMTPGQYHQTGGSGGPVATHSAGNVGGASGSIGLAVPSKGTGGTSRPTSPRGGNSYGGSGGRGGAVNVNVDGGGDSGGYSGGGDGPEYVGGGDAGSVVSILGGGGRRRFRGGVGELVLQGGADEIDDVLVDDGPTDVVDVIGPDVIPANDPTLQGWGMPKLPCPTGTCRR